MHMWTFTTTLFVGFCASRARSMFGSAPESGHRDLTDLFLDIVSHL